MRLKNGHMKATMIMTLITVTTLSISFLHFPYILLINNSTFIAEISGLQYPGLEAIFPKQIQRKTWLKRIAFFLLLLLFIY